MNIDETVKALRDKLTPNGTITLDVDGVGYILDMIERMGNLVEKYECEVIPDYHKVAEQLQAENERLKADQPVRCMECKYWKGDIEYPVKGFCCNHLTLMGKTKSSNYCSYGRRE